MSKEINADYSQSFLLPPSVEDWIGSDHPARFIREFVDGLKMNEVGFKVRSSPEGRPAYGTGLLLKIWIYGYWIGVRSSRRLEWACRENLAMIWLSGRHEPDHNSLWRFWRDNRKALRKLFTQALRVGVEAGLVGTVLHALDGSKIRSRASKATMLSRKNLEKRIVELDQEIREWEKEIAQRERCEGGESRLPEELQQKQALREKVQGGLQWLEERKRAHGNPAEEEARLMKTRAGIDFAYNAQIVVDEKSRMVVAQEVVGETTDHHQLVPMLEQTEENMGQVAEETLADCGYASAAGLEAVGDRPVLVNLKREKTMRSRRQGFHKSEFRYEPDLDQVICPAGKILVFERIKQAKHGKKVRVYRCHCQECGVKTQCTQDKNGRMIEIGPQDQAVTKQREKQRDEANRKRLRKRGGIVEPVFGTIKERDGFRRFRFAGLEKVRAEWALICTVFNLRVIYAKRKK